jgi:hypothetical protein
MQMLTYITAIIGVILGSGSLVLGISNYLRDRPKIRIHLQWNMQMVGASFSANEPKVGLITVTNTGRRPVYISHVCLILPKNYKNRLLLLADSVPGRKLTEGDPPASFIVRHDIQNEYAKDLKRIRARVSDSTGQIYFSKYPKIEKLAATPKPSNLSP